MTEISDRKFVAFGEAVVDVNLIVSVVGTDRMKDNVWIPTVIIVLETGSTVNLQGDSMEAFLAWWKKEKDAGVISAEKAPIPETIQEPVETPTEIPVESLPPPPPVVEEAKTVLRATSELASLPTPTPVLVPVEPTEETETLESTPVNPLTDIGKI